MQPRPQGNPEAVGDCADDLARLGREAGGLANQVMGAVRDPGFKGFGALSYSLAGAAIAIELRQRATDLAALAIVVEEAAEDLKDDQRAWDRRAEAERKEKERDDRGTRDPRGAETGSYAL